MKKATFFFRDGGIIVTEIDDSNTAKNIAQRMATSGFVVGADDKWDSGREVAINLSDVKCVIIHTEEA